MLCSEEWAAHNLRHEEEKSGTRPVVIKTAVHAAVNHAFDHTKTAFSVKGVCTRFGGLVAV